MSSTFALSAPLKTLLASLPPHPIDPNILRDRVARTLDESRSLASTENARIQWEFLLKEEILDLAATEGMSLKQDADAYYTALYDRLDLCLVFTELEACDQAHPFNVLEELLESQTVASCSQIFTWLELRSKRLTVGMVSQKGKSLVLLRALNDLLRRLSKMGSTTIFCGRILTFLSDVFPLGERSAVNLRGEYGPRWEGTEKAASSPSQTNEKEGDAMQVDEPSTKEKSFYEIFWSLQLPFSHPPQFAVPGTFSEFQACVNKVLPVIKEATSKEKAMMGSRASTGPNSLKRKREPELPSEGNSNEYFFAKFLTSPDLLDLEIADAHFRRQFIFQLLVILSHLLNFTKAAQANWSTSRNRSLLMDFTLETAEAQWVHDTIHKATEELRFSLPKGRTFADIVEVILDREQNWVKWKNELCPAFDKQPWFAEVDGRKVGFEEATKAARERLRQPLQPWEFDCGTRALTNVWSHYRGLDDLEKRPDPTDIKHYVKQIRGLDSRIVARRKALERQKPPELIEPSATAEAASSPAPAPSPTPTPIPTPAAVPRAETPAPPPATPSSSQQLSSPPSSSNIPRPTPPAPVGSPLHPSLPAKPGTVSQPQSSPAPVKSSLNSDAAPFTPSSSQEVVAPAMSTPAISMDTVSVSTPVPAPALVAPIDSVISDLEERIQIQSWLALRVAREKHLSHFGKIGTGNVLLLNDEIEKEQKQRQERHAALLAAAEAEAAAASASAGVASGVAEAEGGSEGAAAGADTKPDVSMIAESSSQDVQVSEAGSSQQTVDGAGSMVVDSSQ